MNDVVNRAFCEAHGGYSADRVICDPDLNCEFQARCAARQPRTSPVDFNLALLRLRKSRLLRCKTTRRTRLQRTADIKFAADIAMRFMERQTDSTTDSILANPTLAGQFDSLCSEITPAYAPLYYRWTAMGLRKQRMLAPLPVARIIPADPTRVSLCDLVPDELPATPGVYMFYDRTSQTTMYVGETKNLRLRLRKHVDHSDNRQLAHWFWANGVGNTLLEFHAMAQGTPTKIRRAIEIELIRSRQPRFNIQGRD